jgi:UDP-glucose 4-epimerase
MAGAMSTGRTRVLVTGGTGFVGSHLVRRLVVGKDNDVHIIARLDSPTWRIDDLLEQLTIWRGDLIDRSFVGQCLAECRPEVIYHLAADTRSRSTGGDISGVESSLEINVRATYRLLDILNQGAWPVRRFIRTGGLEEYGCGPYPHIESQREWPVSAYSASQVAATHYCIMLQPYLRFPVVTIRLALVYGPAQSAQFFIPSLIVHCLKGCNFNMTSGKQTRDLLYVDDAVEALLRSSLASGLEGQIINVGSGKGYRMIDVAQAICTAAKSHIGLEVGSAPERTIEVQQLICNPNKAKLLLDWSAQTELATGLASTVEWYRNHIHSSKSAIIIGDAKLGDV